MADFVWSTLKQPILAALDFFKSQGVKPTLRTLYYNLVSQNLIGNTKYVYKGLSKYVVKLRKDGVIPWDAIEDNARTVKGEFKDQRFDDDHEEYIVKRLNDKLQSFNAEEILREFFDYQARGAYVDRWADQPNVAEIWIEKEALAGTIAAWTEHLGIKVRVNKGYSSWTFIYENAKELTAILQKHSHVNIFYLGDLDPSGTDMERYLREALAYFRLDSRKVSLERLSITPEQVEEYKLPPKPEDAETLAKLQRDTRSAKYTLDYIVELDAMVAFVPEQFREIIINAIAGVFDQTIYAELEARAEEINDRIAEALAEVKEKAKGMLKEL